MIMENPTIKGTPMHCYHPNRGWSIDLFGDIIVGYVELVPVQNKTAVFLRCTLNGQDIGKVDIKGLDPQLGADSLEDLIYKASYGRLELVRE